MKTKNLQLSKGRSKKLDAVKVGPFIILERRGPVNYKLKLPPDAKIHPVFHVSMLEPAHPDTPLQENFEYQIEENDTYEVEKILGWNGQMYLIKWKDYPESADTWEHESTILADNPET